MVDLTTSYMGLQLRTPVVPSASPLSRDLDTIQRMADAGAGAITLYSLFEEQIDQEVMLLLPELDEFRRDEHAYLELIQKAKAAVDVPVIASLNGYSEGGWTRYATLFEQAGADAIELNIYYLPTTHRLTGAQVEAMVYNILGTVKQQTTIPVAVKLNPYFSSIPHLARVLDRAGADGLVLFNRFYQPDFDIEALVAQRTLTLSSSQELLLPLRWTAILYGQVDASLAVSTGIHTVEDVTKAMMAGADIANVCSALLKHGVEHLTTLVSGLREWLGAHGYESVRDIKGILSHQTTPDPAAFVRANYIKLVGID